MAKPIVYNGLAMLDLTLDVARTGNGRPGKGVELISVHHEGGPNAPNGTNAFGIANYHVRIQKWDHVGYNWIIERDGQVELVLEPEIAPYSINLSAKYGNDPSKSPEEGNEDYWNEHGLAICLVGNIDLAAATAKQHSSLVNLLVAIRKGAPNVTIKGHGEVAGVKSSCPGSRLNMDQVRAEVEVRLGNADPVTPYIPPSDKPGPGDDEFAKQFVTWRDAYINAKGVADDLGNLLGEIARTMDITVPRLSEARKKISDKTGR